MDPTTEELKMKLDAQRADLSRDMQAIGDRVTPGRVIERRRAVVRQRVYDVRERVMGVAPWTGTGSGYPAGYPTGNVYSGSEPDESGSMTDSMGHMAGQVRDGIASVPDMARERTQGSPLLAGAVAFGLGALAGAVMSPSRMETEYLQQHQEGLRRATDTVKSGLSEVMQEAKEDLQPEVQNAAAHLSDSARSRAEEVKSQATGAQQ